MTVSSEDVVNAIAKLNDLTRRHVLTWSTLNGAKEDAREIKSSYWAAYEGRRLRITEYGAPRSSSKWAQAAYDHPSRERNRVEDQPRYKLEIVDDERSPIYVFPNVQGIADLFATARAQSVDVEGLIKSLLAMP
jgi:hypothetical protein